MSTRITQRTRTSGWQNAIAASSAATFSTRTDDPSLSTVMAPALTVVLGFGKQSGLRAVSKQPFTPHSAPVPRPIEQHSQPADTETGSSGVADVEIGAVDRADAEIGAAEDGMANLPSDQSAAEAALDDDALRSDGEQQLGLADPPEELAAAPVESEPDEPESAQPAQPHRIDMTIESLPHHDLSEPIPIYIDPLGDTLFTASVANLDISATGNSIGDAMVLLKEQIEFKYGDLNRRTKRSPEQTTMLQMLHTYIAPSGGKPSWL